jgi:anthranilate phosphoribosyltransferase
MVAGVAGDLPEGFDLAVQNVRNGNAANALAKLVALSNA